MAGNRADGGSFQTAFCRDEAGQKHYGRADDQNRELVAHTDELPLE
jgi:hypothetical protein